MKNNFLLIIGMTYLTIIFCPAVFAQGQSLADEYDRSELQADRLEKIIEERFKKGEIDELLGELQLSDRMIPQYREWLLKKYELLRSKKIVSVECKLPVLGFSPYSALIHNGTFRVVHEKDSDRTYEFIRFNEFILSWEDESLKTKIYIPGDEIETGIPEVANSRFDVEVLPYLEKLNVKASFDLQITDISSGPFSIFFRYPITFFKVTPIYYKRII